MKKSLFLLLFTLAVSFIQAQKIDENQVPANVKAAFQKAYSSIKSVKWEKDKSNYEANFKIEGIEESATFDVNGNLIETEKEIKTSALPKLVLDYLAKNLPGQKINEASEIKSATGVITYEAEVNEIDYLFDASGKLLKQETDKD